MALFNELSELAGKGDKEIFFYSKYIGRKISKYFSYLFIKLGVSPNFVTLVSLLSAIFSCFFIVYARDNIYYALLAVVLINLYMILDHSDGEVARFYVIKKIKAPSIKGGYFDYLVHFYSTNLMFFCLGLGLYLETRSLIFIFMGLISCIGLSNFPRLCLSHTLILEVYKNRELLKSRNIEKILSFAEANNEVSSIVNSKGFSREKFIRLIKELLTFPGCMLLLSLVLMSDSLFGGTNIFSISYLSFFTVFILLNIVRRSYLIFRGLDDVR